MNPSGRDNDCDGQIDDEGTCDACGICGAVPVENCDNQDNDCDGEIDEGLAQPEVCDGRDNDCDGDGA